MLSFLYKEKRYPGYIKDGFHSQYIFPIAQKVCKGIGIDVGAHKSEWALPGSTIIDLMQPEPFNNALKLPFEAGSLDYVFSSHCLEHIPNWLAAIREWTRVIKPGGCLFLYLPHRKMRYWWPTHNLKHHHVFRAKDISRILVDLEYRDVFSSGRDLAWSFAVFGMKARFFR